MIWNLLRSRSAETPKRSSYIFLANGEEESARLSHGDLALQVGSLAATLAKTVPAGSRALLVFPPGLEFVTAFLGCLVSGVVAVPIVPPNPNRDSNRMRGIVLDAEPSLVLTTQALLPGLERLAADAPEFARVDRIAIDDLPVEDGDGARPSPSDIAFLQYTSGSTASPKGVIVTHASLVENERMIQEAFRQDEGSVVVGWLPLYHDMGLIGNVLQPLFCGGSCVLMSPLSFLQRPSRWLSAISRYQATTSGGPSFAYELCASQIIEEERLGLDLSSWRMAFCGAEPVRADTLERFAAAFAPQGFRREAFYPCYGLAEATLFVTGPPAGEPLVVGEFSSAALQAHDVVAADGLGSQRLVGCGRPWRGQRVLVVDPETRVPCAPDRVGEIWVAGPSVARGYWRQLEATERDFQARLAGGEGPFLRTGDLGFARDGSLFVTGRLKDLIILRGRNHYPQDVELTMERSHPAVRPGCAAAFSLEVDGEERLILVGEVQRHPGATSEEILEAVRRGVAEEHEVQAHAVVLIRSATLLKTSSGKVRRSACRAAYVAGELQVVAQSTLSAGPGLAGSEQLGREELLAVPPAGRRRVLEADLEARVARVLRLEARPPQDRPLTALGLDSLAACELKADLESALAVPVSLSALLSGATTGDLADGILAGLEAAGAAGLAAADAVGPQSELRLSAGQRAIWLLERLGEGSSAYQIAGAARLAGQADVAALRAAFQVLTDRHAALRTIFEERAGGLIQVVRERQQAEVGEEDTSALDPAGLEERVRAAAFAPFDLERGPLFRATLLRRPDGDVLVFAAHHIVADFWSLGILAREFGTLLRNPDGELPALAFGYGDHMLRQDRLLAGERAEGLWRYWTERLAGAPPLDLPTDQPRPRLQSFRGAARNARLGRAATEEINRLARVSGSTAFSVLLAAFQSFLGRLSGQEDFLVGTPTAGRLAPEFAGVIGYFVNPVALRAELAGRPSVREALARTRRSAVAALEHQELPFPLLTERLHPERDPGRPTLVQTLLVVQKAPSPELAALAAFALGEPGARIDLGGWNLETLAMASPAAAFDLTLTAAEVDGDLALSLNFNTDLFSATTGERLLGHFLQLLRQLPRDIRRPMTDLDLLSREERQQLLYEWNASDAVPGPWPERGLHGLVERQADRTPHATAVIWGEERLSYRELDRQADRLAQRLQCLGAGPERGVGVFLRRRPEMVVAILAVLKSGSAYLPLDPAYPRERVQLLLDDSAAPLVVTEEALLPSLPPFHGRLVLIGEEPETGSERGLLRMACLPEQLAYVIYTSGSTGVPKGVAVRHAGVVARMVWALAAYSPEELAGVLFSTSICFDLSVFELFVPLAAGGTVILADDALALPSLPAAASVTLLNVVPSAVAELLRGRAIPRSVRTVILGGEASQKELVAGLMDLPWRPEVHNLYGPTEDTIYSTRGLLVRGEDRNPPIGFPLAGSRSHVLDPHLELLAVGVPGELWLGGCGLARGYLGRPDLTADRFRPDFLSEEPGARLYRTGDRVRRLADGELDYLDRLDRQVKVRGFRIEPGEIEVALAAQPGVMEAAVVVREEAGKGRSLAAFLRAKATVDAAWLRECLAASLPRPLVPDTFEILDDLPRTPNGKVDRGALSKRAAASAPAARGYVMPETEAESLVARVFAELLGVERVGSEDNFFDLGGSSLLMIELRARLRRHLGRDFSIAELFQYPTVRSLARHLSQESAPRAAASTVAEPVARLPESRDIAIVGMAGRFPRAGDIEAFWRNLEQGIETISFFSDEELLASGEPTELIRDPRYVRARGVLEGAASFDAAFFGYNAREAAMIDPQQRLFLECSWEALENAGYDPQRYPGAIGVFGGASPSTYGFRLLEDPDILRTFGQIQIMLASDKDYLCSRVAYKLDLRGPSVVVQTACSTSLTAVHMAASALLLGECDMALAGGVGVSFPQQVGYLYQEGGTFSPDGHCRAFDSRARGMVSGQGVGVVVLKRLADALADGDTIHAVVKGSAINNDGGLKPGYTAPSVEGQARVIRAALDAAGVSPDTVTYVEAHGSATEMGDPIEVAALTQAFGSLGDSRGACALGSVKSNIGHLESASGVASLIKTVLALEHRVLPPSLHFETPNREIDFASGPFYVNTRSCTWPAGPTPRRAGVSSFGLGGTNAHVLLEEAPAAAMSEASARSWQVILLSARTAHALERMAANLAAHLRAQPMLDPADVAYTFQVGRRVFEHRRTVVAQGAEDAVRLLEAVEPGCTATRAHAYRPSVAFLFPGLADQYTDMGLGLYRSEPVFRDAIDRCAELLAARFGLDLRSLLYPGLGHGAGEKAEAAVGVDLRRMLRPHADWAISALDRTGAAHPAQFATEYALARLWIAWGVRPRAMLGHSLGEYVAACLAGVFSLEDALTLVTERARLIEDLPPGAMVAVPLGERQVERFLGEGVSLAVVNGPSLTVLAGSPEAMNGLERRLSSEGLFYRRLNVAIAFHSPMMEPAAAELLALLRSVELRSPAIPYLSNVTGTWIEPSQATDPAYWVRHLCQTVRFGDGLRELAREEGRILLEVGPGQRLGSIALQQFRDGDGGEPVVLASLRNDYDAQPDEGFLLKTVGQLWVHGAEIDWSAFHAGERRRRVPLPTYPFERRHYLVGADRLPTAGPGRDTADWTVETGPEPEPVRPVVEQAGTDSEPDEIEQALAALWRELLGVEEVVRHDNFFQLGGHSLLGIQVLAGIQRTLGVELSLRDLLTAPTLGQQVEAVVVARERSERGQLPIQPLARKAGEERLFPLSFAQERLWFLEQLQPGLAAYSIPYAVRLRGLLDVGAMEASLAGIVRRHEALRSSFGVLSDRLVQRVENRVAPGFGLVDLSDLPSVRREPEMRRQMAVEAERPFDLTQTPLMRACLLRLGPDEHVLVMSLHHIVSDGWSLGVLGREMSAAYGALSSGRPADLDELLGELPVQYGDYAAWQREWLRPARLESELGYWREHLKEAPTTLDLPADRLRPAAQSFRGREIPFAVPAGIVERLQGLAREEGATLFMALLASFSALLSRTCSQEDLVVGTAFANRGRPEIEGLIGFFVNTLPLRMDLSGYPSLRELLGQAREVSLGAYERQQMPFVSLVEALQPQRDLSRSPLFDVMLVLQEKSEGVLGLSGLVSELVPLHNGTSKFDLTLSLAPVADGLSGGLEFSTDLFETDTAERLLDHFSNLLEVMTSEPGRSLSEVELLGAAERRQVLEEWSFGGALKPQAGFLHELVEAQAERTPEAVAVVWGEERVTYRELVSWARQLGGFLHGLGVGAEDRVGVLLERRPGLVTALLGVLESGAAYLPLDPAYPAERLSYLLADSGAPVVLTERRLASALPLYKGEVVFLDDRDLTGAPVTAGGAVDPDQLAYLIYTSGSTGRPKGVGIPHRGAVAMVSWGVGAYPPAYLSGVLAATSVCFDLSVFELFVPLSMGGTVVLADDALSLPGLAAAGEVSLVNTVPSAMAELVRSGGVPSSVRVVNLAGEPLRGELAARLYELPGIVAVHNLYGPSEDTTYSTGVHVPRTLAGEPTIGRPLAGRRAYVLDRSGRPAPVGVLGELWVGGPGLSRGYVGRPDLTAWSFVRTRSAASRAAACTGPATWRAGRQAASWSSSAASTTRSRCAGFGSSWARSRRRCRAIRRSRRRY